MQSSSGEGEKEEEQHNEDVSTQVGREEAIGKSDPFSAQDSLVPQPDDLGPEPEPDLSMDVPTSPQSGPNTSEVMTDPELPEKDDGEKEEELVILDPDHPLVKRLQDALNSNFRKTLERIKQELSEKWVVKKADDIQLQEVGIEAFRVQELLTKMRNKMEDVVQIKVKAEVQRRQAQDQVEVTKSKFSDLSKKNSQEESHATKLQGKLDKLLQQLRFTQGVSEDLQSNVKTMKNVQNRAGAEKTQAGEQKLKQDLYIDRLTKELERFTRQAAMYEAQKIAQAEETREAKEAFSEAEMEMESLLLARKELLQQWNNSLTSIGRKNETFCEMQKALHSAEHQLILLEREIEVYKKTTAAEQEKNETLTVGLNWCEMDCATSKKLISQKQAALEVLQAKYSACLRSLRETERTVATLTKESDIFQTELNDQKKQFEEENSVRLELEDKIMDYIQQQFMHTKAAKYSQHLISKMAALKKDKICQLQQVDNDMLSVAHECQQINERLSSLAVIQEALTKEADKYNKLLTASQTNFSSSARLIEQKQVTIASLTNKISIIAADTGRDDLSPYHIKVQGTMAQIDELTANIRDGQQLWMMKQGILVGLSKDLETNSRMMLKLQYHYTGMRLKKIHLENQIKQEERDNAELEKSSKILERDLEKLSVLLHKNQHLSCVLEEENTLMETDFIQHIKEAEWESIGIQMKVRKLLEEKEMLLHSLGHAEQQIMLWERKTQLLKETCSVLDSQMAQEEIQKMKAEIHRMELRVIQLTKQQEQLMRESEAAVARRESILLQKEAMARSLHRETTVAELKRAVESLERSIQKSHVDVAGCEEDILKLEMSKDHLSNQLVQQQQQLTEESYTSKKLDSDLEILQNDKDTKQTYLFALQSQSKKLQVVCGGSYRLSSSSETVGAALQSQRERLEAVGSVLRGVHTELPQHHGVLSKVSQALEAYRQISQQKAFQ